MSARMEIDHGFFRDHAEALAPLKKMWAEIEIAQDRRDLVLTKDLGRVRDAIGLVAAMVAAIGSPSQR